MPPQQEKTPVRVGMLGLGTVGSGVYKTLSKRDDIEFQWIAVSNLNKDRGIENLDQSLLTDEALKALSDKPVDILIEVAGGTSLANELMTAAINAGAHVVTANKELVAKEGHNLYKLSGEKNCRLLCEGAVAGGIPVLSTMKASLSANQIDEVAGILNGTTNYILTQMTENGSDFADVLKVAQELGFAEADPTSDVEGYDARYKTAILGMLAFGKTINPDDIFCEGITKISALDIDNARALGFRIKLLGIAKRLKNNRVDIRVHPLLVPEKHPLANIHNEFNAVWVKGDVVGETMFYGRGAGEFPTASAVCGDVLMLAEDLKHGNTPQPLSQVSLSEPLDILPVDETVNRYYIRLNTTDHAGVIGNLGQACGKNNVSLESVVQKGTNDDKTASIILITHDVKESELQQALKEIEAQDTTREIACVLRVMSEH